MMKQRKGYQLFVAGLMAGTFFTGLGMAEAAYVNPYQYPKTAAMTTRADKMKYMENKTATMFKGTKKAEEAYVVPKGWTEDLATFKNVRVEKYMPQKKGTDRVLFFLHGGGYVQGISNGYRDWAIAQSHALGDADTYLLDYRISPEAQYPEILNEAVAAYKAILSSGVPADKIVVAGDSAGGNLTTVLALYARDHQLPMPGLLVLYSPWEDAGHLPTHDTNVKKDLVLGENNPSMLKAVNNNEDYFRTADLKDPYVSPVYADLKNLPPTLIIGGKNELFVDDMALYTNHAQAAGSTVEMHLFDDMSHDWPFIFPELSEAKETYTLMSSFADKYMK